VILFTLSVKFCVASVPTPLLAVMVIGYVPTVPNAGVPLSTPAEVKVTPLGRPGFSKLGEREACGVTGNDPAVFTVKVALLALVMAGGWPTVKVKALGRVWRHAIFAVIVMGKFPVTVGVPPSKPVVGF